MDFSQLIGQAAAAEVKNKKAKQYYEFKEDMLDDAIASFEDLMSQRPKNWKLLMRNSNMPKQFTNGKTDEEGKREMWKHPYDMVADQVDYADQCFSNLKIERVDVSEKLEYEDFYAGLFEDFYNAQALMNKVFEETNGAATVKTKIQDYISKSVQTISKYIQSVVGANTTDFAKQCLYYSSYQDKELSMLIQRNNASAIGGSFQEKADNDNNQTEYNLERYKYYLIRLYQLKTKDAGDKNYSKYISDIDKALNGIKSRKVNNTTEAVIALERFEHDLIGSDFINQIGDKEKDIVDAFRVEKPSPKQLEIGKTDKENLWDANKYYDDIYRGLSSTVVEILGGVKTEEWRCIKTFDQNVKNLADAATKEIETRIKHICHPEGNNGLNKLYLNVPLQESGLLNLWKRYEQELYTRAENRKNMFANGDSIEFFRSFLSNVVPNILACMMCYRNITTILEKNKALASSSTDKNTQELTKNQAELLKMKSKCVAVEFLMKFTPANENTYGTMGAVLLDNKLVQTKEIVDIINPFGEFLSKFNKNAEHITSMEDADIEDFYAKLMELSQMKNIGTLIKKLESINENFDNAKYSSIVVRGKSNIDKLQNDYDKDAIKERYEKFLTAKDPYTALEKAKDNKDFVTGASINVDNINANVLETCDQYVQTILNNSFVKDYTLMNLHFFLYAFNNPKNAKIQMNETPSADLAEFVDSFISLVVCNKTPLDPAEVNEAFAKVKELIETIASLPSDYTSTFENEASKNMKFKVTSGNTDDYLKALGEAMQALKDSGITDNLSVNDKANFIDDYFLENFEGNASRDILSKNKWMFKNDFSRKDKVDTIYKVFQGAVDGKVTDDVKHALKYLKVYSSVCMAFYKLFSLPTSHHTSYNSTNFKAICGKDRKDFMYFAANALKTLDTTKTDDEPYKKALEALSKDVSNGTKKINFSYFLTGRNSLKEKLVEFEKYFDTTIAKAKKSYGALEPIVIVDNYIKTNKLLG